MQLPFLGPPPQLRLLLLSGFRPDGQKASSGAPSLKTEAVRWGWGYSPTGPQSGLGEGGPLHTAQVGHAIEKILGATDPDGARWRTPYSH